MQDHNELEQILAAHQAEWDSLTRTIRSMPDSPERQGYQRDRENLVAKIRTIQSNLAKLEGDVAELRHLDEPDEGGVIVQAQAATLGAEPGKAE